MTVTTSIKNGTRAEFVPIPFTWVSRFIPKRSDIDRKKLFDDMAAMVSVGYLRGHENYEDRERWVYLKIQTADDCWWLVRNAKDTIPDLTSIRWVRRCVLSYFEDVADIMFPKGRD